MIELFEIIKAGYASAVSPIVEQITGHKPVTFEQFAKDYAERSDNLLVFTLHSYDGLAAPSLVAPFFTTSCPCI